MANKIPSHYRASSVEITTLTAISVLYFILGTASFFALSKGLGLSNAITSASPLFGFLCSIYFGYISSDVKRTLIATTATIGLIALSFIASNLLFDFSPDTTGYHQDAILELSKHFDFFRSSLSGYSSLYTNNYPKLSWFYSTSIYELTGNMHYGKSINFLLLFALWISTYSALSNINAINRIITTTAIAANPIVVTQLFTHYVDGALGAFLTISIIGLFGFFWTKRSVEYLILTAAGIIGCASLKHTGFVFSGLIALATLYLALKLKPSSLAIVTKPAVYIPVLGITLLLTANPYLKNLIEGKHIFYPTMGEGKVGNLISGQTTKQFYEADQVSKLIMSVFGKTENQVPDISEPLPALKIPFTVTQSEIDYAKGVDVRWGGWGPLFGGVLLVTLAFLLLRSHQIREYMPLVILLALLSTISPESWWARLNPQLHTFVAFSLLFFYIKDPRSRWVFNLMFAVLILNSLLIFKSSIRNTIDGDHYIEGVINEISKNKSEPVCWDFKRAHLEPIFERIGVPWTPQSNCQSQGKICKELLGETICSVQDSK